jgi:hypothetical protein
MVEIVPLPREWLRSNVLLHTCGHSLTHRIDGNTSIDVSDVQFHNLSLSQRLWRHNGNIFCILTVPGALRHMNSQSYLSESAQSSAFAFPGISNPDILHQPGILSRELMSWITSHSVNLIIIHRMCIRCTIELGNLFML